MKSFALIAALLFAAAPATLPAAPAKKPAAVPARDWLKVINRTPAGAFVIGNPAAKVKLVEYLSLTCSHCAHFAAEGYPALEANYIRPGLVSLEVRHAVRDGFDMAASILARCGAPGAYLGAVSTAFAKQDKWLGRAQAFSAANQDKLEKMNENEVFPAIAAGVGLDKLFAARGLTPARQKVCLTSVAEVKTLTASADEAWQKRQIPGTPAFYINGTHVAGSPEWAVLEPALKAALR
ncbi:thioredoxin domain-containing protein [Sphingomonas naphthae]|uniref:Thioredoxin domain-containing protein n=1 Tax=Sphingomonas naphthae TaxID=1813468 RepID=A0ABY7TQV5_9SPHN|nr:thioredoxin domain-containing protein [Sphingomonas naphthae]WCT75330.1 thioredoxin domain-containing protein [Sphingomonas naphthae]